jgi:hypothetical protein
MLRKSGIEVEFQKSGDRFIELRMPGARRQAQADPPF